MTPLDHYREHGWARLGRTLGDETLEALRARTDELMLGTRVVDGLFFQHDAESGKYEDLEFGKGWIGPSLDYRKLEKLERDPLFLSVVEHPRFEPIVRAIISGDVVIYRAMLMNKPARGGSETPWHQDGGLFWGLDRDPVLQIWTALDDAPEDGGCIEVVDRSHLRGLVSKNGGLISEEHTHGVVGTKLPCRAGETLLVHNQVWHRSGRTRPASKPRRAFTVCYMSAETKCTRTRRAPRTFFPVFARSEEREQRAR